MTNKIYTTAKGKPVDLGALRLQNENVRAVGNMGVNSRGDRIDAQGNIIDSVNHQIQRKIQKQTNVTSGTVHTSQQAVQAATPAVAQPIAEPVVEPVAVAAPPPANTTKEIFDDFDGPMDEPLDAVAPEVEVKESVETVVTDITDAPQGGLAAAIARAKTVKQELEKTAKQQFQDKGVRKI